MIDQDLSMQILEILEVCVLYKNTLMISLEKHIEFGKFLKELNFLLLEESLKERFIREP